MWKASNQFVSKYGVFYRQDQEIPNEVYYLLQDEDKEKCYNTGHRRYHGRSSGVESSTPKKKRNDDNDFSNPFSIGGGGFGFGGSSFGGGSFGGGGAGGDW